MRRARIAPFHQHDGLPAGAAGERRRLTERRVPIILRGPSNQHGASTLSPDRRTTASELHVTAAGAFEHVLHALAEPFREETGNIIRLSITNAGGVIRKIEADEPADVVLTSSAGIDALAAKGRVDPATKVEVGRMRLGVAVNPSAADPDLATADTLRATLLAAPGVAYIDPKGGGTSGPYFVTLFGRLGMSGRDRPEGRPVRHRQGGGAGRRFRPGHHRPDAGERADRRRGRAVCGASAGGSAIDQRLLRRRRVARRLARRGHGFNSLRRRPTRRGTLPRRRMGRRVGIGMNQARGTPKPSPRDRARGRST